MKNPLLVYHANCTDGFGSNYFATKYFLEEGIPIENILSIPADYKKQDQVIERIMEQGKGRDIFVMDFSFSPKVIKEEILPISSSVTILDHHKTAMDQWAKLGDDSDCYTELSENLAVYFDMNRSGALMTWEHFFWTGKHVYSADHHHAIAEYISDWDTFKFKYGTATKEFNAYIKTLPKTIAAWSEIDTRPLPRMLEEGYFIRKGVQAIIDQEVVSSNIKRISFYIKGETFTGLSLNTSFSFASEIGNVLAENCGTFAVIWNTDGEVAKCSIRSVKGFDCSKIAVSFGGGGHPGASGFSIPLPQLISAINNGIRE